MRNSFWAQGDSFYQWEIDHQLGNMPIESYLAINANLNLITLDPNSLQIKKSNRIDFIGDYSLYEVLYSSPIRTSSIRALYNAETMDFRRLDGTHLPILDTWNLTLKPEHGREVTKQHLDENNACNYLKFFTDSVKGSHGKFEIVENADEFKNRLHNHHSLHNSTIQNFGSLDERLEAVFFQTKVLAESQENFLVIENLHCTYCGSLYCLSVKIFTDKEINYGKIQIFNTTKILLD